MSPAAGEGRPVFLDHHATTPVDPRVVDAMLPWLTERFGNAASRSHAYGWEAEEAVEAARAEVAALIGGRAKEIVWTSGATESDNLALKGVLEAAEGRHLVTCATEHKAVLDPAKHLARQGVEVTVLGVDAEGRVDPAAVDAAIREDTALISIMWVNNEVGTVQPIGEIGRIAKERGVLFHCDAVQGLSTMTLDVEEAGVDLVSLSAHKMYGPKGVGALWVRRRAPRVKLIGQIDGGGHERGMRSGTLNVPGIVAFGEAARIATRERDEDRRRIAALRDRLRRGIEAALDGVHLNGPPTEAGRRHPGNLNLSFDHVESEALMLALKDVVAVSSGSACTSASLEPSYVLRAMGVDEDRAHASVRFGVGRTTTEAEIDRVLATLVPEVERLRALSPRARLAAEGVEIDW